jgi:hypothetical protein
MTSKAQKQIEQFTRNLLQQQLNYCTLGQVGVFNRMYGSVAKIPMSKVRRAFEQIEATHQKNKEWVWPSLLVRIKNTKLE